MTRKLLLLAFSFFIFTDLFAQTVLIDPSTVGGFESGTTFADNGWTEIGPGGSNRRWYCGTGQSGYSGNRAAFIGNNTTTVGSNTNNRTVHLYRSITIPSDAQTITLTFKYKQAIADPGWDFLRVSLLSSIPTNGVIPETYVVGDVNPSSGITSYTTQSINISRGYAGTTRYLTFTFNADNVSPHAYGAVDDISLVYTTCSSPSDVVINTIDANVCPSTSNPISVTGGVYVDTALEEYFTNGIPLTWSKINNSTGGTVANAAWTIYDSSLSSGYITSNDNTEYVLSDSDAQGIGGTTATELISPTFSLEDYSSATLNFYHYYNFNAGSESAKVEISVNGGSYTNLVTYSSTQGLSNNFQLVTIDLSSYIGYNNLKIRFKYDATYDWYWAIDNVTIKGNKQKITWSPTTNLYTDSGLSTPYVSGNHATTLYANPSATTTYTATSAIGACSKTDQVTFTVQTAVYSGSWSPALATNQSIEINADYTLATDMDVCACKVNSGKKLTVPSATTLTVQNGIDNAGEIVINHTGSLVQVKETNTNTGAGVYKIKKTTGGYYQYDYIYWSSPIENQNIENVFKTTDGFSNYKYKFVPQAYNDTRSGLRTGATQPTAGTADGFDDEGNDWTSFATGTMEEGLGYIVMGKGSVFPFSIANASNAVSGYNVEFSGNKVNNGAVNITLYKDAYNTALPFVTGFETKNINLNLVGNPYPSSISTAELYADNSALIEPNFYFWTHAKKLAAIGGPYAYDFSNDSFASATVSGGVVTTNALATGLSGLDYEYIASGQGFFVQAKNGITSGTSQLTFNNSMRGGSYPNTSFLKTNDTNTLSRIWLSLTEGNGNKNNIAVGFSSSATDGYGVNDVPRIDSAIDTEFYSLIAGENGDFDIQFMSDFAIEKTIPLGLEILTTDTYIISLEGYEGIFTQDQKIYLEDTYLDVIHNLNEGPYTFTQSAGNNINDRFILRFTNSALGNEESVFNQVKVYPNPSTGVFNIAYYGSETLQYTIYDLTGKTVMTGSGNQINLSQQAIGLYFAKITDGSAVRTLKLVRE